MNVLIDLLPPVNQMKIETPKKDKRQRNKHNRQITSATSKDLLAKQGEKGGKQIFGMDLKDAHLLNNVI